MAPSLVRLRRVTLAAALGAAAPLAAATFRVGNDGIGPCTHTTVAAAVAAAAANGAGLDQIYVSDPFTIASTIDIDDHAVEIVGGFSDCNDNTPTGRTSVTANADPSFWVHGGTSMRTVNLQELNVIRGTGGRLLRIEDRAFVTLYDTLLSNGQATDGANVWLSGENAIFWVTDDSTVYSGDATGVGGGVYCSAGGTVLIDDGGAITDNTAVDGGGLYLDDCVLNAYSGDTTTVTCPAGAGSQGILCNSADNRGGGVFATNGTLVNLIGGDAAPMRVAENDAAIGGGLYLNGATTDGRAHNAWITGNTGDDVGGGVAANGGASFAMDVTVNRCSRVERCSLFEGNGTALGGVGGAVAVDAGADVTIHQTTLTGNFALARGSLFWVNGSGSTALCEGCLTFANGGSTGEALIESDHDAAVTMGFSTVDEEIGGRGIFDTANGADVAVYSSILLAETDVGGLGKVFEEPAAAGEGRVADCVLFQEDTYSLPAPLDPGSQEVVFDVADLRFVDHAGRDYRLRSGSQAIDFCDTYRYAPSGTDIEREAWGFDDPATVASPFANYDLGFDEWRPLFVDGFATANCSRWSSGGTGC